jgi:hypothetical protein
MRVPYGLCHILVSIPCHIEPDVRFALIRLPDSLSSSGIQGFKQSDLLPLTTASPAWLFSAPWHTGLVCAGVVVIYLWVWLAPWGHAPSLTSPLDTAEVEALPSRQVMLS